MSNKFCPRCQESKPVAEFSKNKARANRDGLASYCKACSRSYGKEKAYDKARYAADKDGQSDRHRKYMQGNRDQLDRYRDRARAYRKNNPAKVNATNRSRGKWNFVPVWADKHAMVMIYKKARELSELFGVEYQVDHIVPLRGKTVCGLHCEANLQLLAADLNHKKRHWSWPDMPE